MAEISHTEWYRQGLVSVTDGSTTVTGNGTKFLSAGINPGAALRIDSRPYAWEVKSVISDTELELARPYYGGTVSNVSYSIDRNHQSTLPADLAARLASITGKFEAHYNLDMQTITGHSAYEIACLHGYVGTEAEWVESLKGAGEIVALNEKIAPYMVHNEYTHNSLFRGKNLGSAITEEQLAVIRSGLYTDIYPRDYWEINFSGSLLQGKKGICVVKCRGAFKDYEKDWTWKGHILCAMSIGSYPINSTATCEGHLVNSMLYTEIFPQVLEDLSAHIDLDRLIPFNDFTWDAIDANGKPSHAAGYSSKLILPSAFNFGLAGNYDELIRKSAFPTHGARPWLMYWNRCVDDNVCWLSSNASATQWHIGGHQYGGQGFVEGRAANLDYGTTVFFAIY